MDLGDRLKSLRDSYELTISHVSSQTGIGQSTISEIETGKAKNPKIDTLNKLADYYNVTVDYLMGTVPFKNKTEAQHSIGIASVKLLREDYSARPNYWDPGDSLDVLYDNTTKEIFSYCSRLIEKFRNRNYLSDIELYELSSIMFSSIKWSTDYDGIVYLENFSGGIITIELDFKKIEKTTLDLSKSYLFKNKEGNNLELEQSNSIFNITDNIQEESAEIDSESRSEYGYNLEENDKVKILLHEASGLDEEDIEKIIQIAKAWKDGKLPGE